MYDKSDPRASLAPAGTKGPTFESYHPSQYVRFYEKTPQVQDDLVRTWLTRGQNAITAYSETKSGARFERKNQVDEWALLLPDPEVTVEVSVGGHSHRVSEIR